MARSHGVVIVSEHYWAYAGVDGSLKEGEMPQTPRALRAVPLARGLVRLAASLSPLSRSGVYAAAGPLRPLLSPPGGGGRGVAGVVPRGCRPRPPRPSFFPRGG